MSRQTGTIEFPLNKLGGFEKPSKSGALNDQNSLTQATIYGLNQTDDRPGGP